MDEFCVWNHIWIHVHEEFCEHGLIHINEFISEKIPGFRNLKSIPNLIFLNSMLKSISYGMILASNSKAGFSTCDSFLIEKWYCHLPSKPLTVNPHPSPPPTNAAISATSSGPVLLAYTILGKSLSSLFVLCCKNSLNSFTSGLFNCSRLFSKSALVRPAGRLVGRQLQHSLEVGNKRLGYLLTLI